MTGFNNNKIIRVIAALLTVIVFVGLFPVSTAAESLDEALKNASGDALTLSYDDVFYLGNTYKNMRAVSISENNVSSYKVSGGTATGIKDDAVVSISDSGGLILRACGIGTATVTLVNDKDYKLAEKIINGEASGATLDDIASKKITVTVNPAVLTLMFLFGQSNAEGLCSGLTGSHPEDSVACKAGTVYSTYLPRSASVTADVTGISGVSNATASNCKKFVAGSLTGDRSVSGTKLLYPLDALTTERKGKTGPDAALAYEWNRLSDEKVWVINASYGGTSITKWLPGCDILKRAVSAGKIALKTAAAEIAAGHFTAGKKLMFWLQGEADKNLTVYEYLAHFEDMYKYIDSEIGVDKCGIISVRAAGSGNDLYQDVYMTGPRMAQYYMASSNDYPDIYVVSNANEQWITDKGVKSYFYGKYPSGRLTYPLRTNASIKKVPTDVDEVHSDIHYSQVGHNENGITAANCMYNIITGASSNEAVVSFFGYNGREISEVSVNVGLDFTAVPKTFPLYCSKEFNVAAGERVSYSRAVVIGQKSGSSYLKATGNGKTFMLKINVKLKKAPEITVKSVADGVYVSWSAAQNVSKYRVDRSEDGKTWSVAGKTSALMFTDKTAKSGKTYKYRVSGLTADGSNVVTEFSALKTIRYIAAPVITLQNRASAVTVSWTRPAGTQKYRVFKRSAGGAWKKLCDTSASSYTDKDVVNGNSYYYTVRAINTSGKYISSYYTDIRIKFLTVGRITSLKNTSKGITVNWKENSRCDGYYVYRKTENGKYSLIETVKKSSVTAYTDTSVAKNNGVKYYYAVRPFAGSSKGAFVSKAYVRLTGTSITGVTPSGSSLTVRWKKVQGVSGYQLLLKTAAESKTVTVGSAKTYTTISGIKNVRGCKVYVRTYKTVSGVKYYSGWSVAK